MTVYRECADVPIEPSELGEYRLRCPECDSDLHRYYSPWFGCGEFRFGTFCGPNKRRRFGFLWLKRCNVPNTHIHQRCKRCGWAEVRSARRPK